MKEKLLVEGDGIRRKTFRGGEEGWFERETSRGGESGDGKETSRGGRGKWGWKRTGVGHLGKPWPPRFGRFECTEQKAFEP